MEQHKSYYSLEKHLEESSKLNSNFEILDAIWKLNKRNLASALSNVNQYYPHYSLHEKSHSNRIISNIESFLGEDRIRKLSPTNAWLILMSSFTHDLGMIVFQDLIENVWISDDFQVFLNEISEWDDFAMSEAGKDLLNLQRLSQKKAINDANKEWVSKLTPLKIKKSVTLAVAEYIRRSHHKRSSDIIKGIDKEFYNIANSFYSNQIPKRLLNILAEVAYLHGVDFYEIFKRLDYESNGIANDKINPRFISCLLRLGDLLDVDDNRFNLFTEKVFNFPQSSINHKDKHSSIIHLLITPEAIEITSDCPNEEVYRLSRSWFDWLEEEVEKQSKEWSNIAPKDIGGSSPTIPKGKIKVYFQSKIIEDKFLNLRFEVSNKKIFEILEGASIYEKAEFTFIRELIQNALDASKIQLWTEIEKGTFDYFLRNHFQNEELSHEELMKKIIFPDDIPQTLIDTFGIKLSINWEDEFKQALLIVVEDNGTGISDSDLLRMTTQVGESRKKNTEYQKMLLRMPFWLRPTGAFGIGLQSVFIIVDSFKVQTKSEGEVSKEIIFRSAKKGKYSSVSNYSPVMSRGTKVIINIPQERFPEVFGTSFDWNIIMDYDYFTDEHRSIYIPKIRRYLVEILPNIKSLQIDFFSKKLNLVSAKQIEFNKSTPVKSKDNNIQCTLSIKDSIVYFQFFESIIGTEFILCFLGNNMDGNMRHWSTFKNDYFVRDIPVKDNSSYYFKLSYSKLYWNFMSPESDKILSLTRDKFISKKKDEFTDIFLRDIIPSAIALAEQVFISNKSKILTEFNSHQKELSYIYFNFILTKYINRVKGETIDSEFVKGFALPIELASYCDEKPIKIIDFFNIEKVIIPISNQPNPHDYSNIEKKKELLKLVLKVLPRKKDIIVIWNNDFFTQYLGTEFKIKEMSFNTLGRVLFMDKSEEDIKIKVGFKEYLTSLIQNQDSFKRAWYYSINKYDSKISIANAYATGFEHFPYLAKKSIISPFIDYKTYSSFKDKLMEQIDIKDAKKVKKALTNQVISEFVTETLVEWVIQYKPKNVLKRSRQDVFDGYRELIEDILINDI